MDLFNWIVLPNLVSPRIMGATLGINPAAVHIVAIMAANMIGIVGQVLAAPVLAKISLLGQNVIRKLLDLDPWPEPEPRKKAFEPPLFKRAYRSLRAGWKKRKG